MLLRIKRHHSRQDIRCQVSHLVQKKLANLRHRKNSLVWHMDMDAFICYIKNGQFQIEEGTHMGMQFTPINKLRQKDWCPADSVIVEKSSVTRKTSNQINTTKNLKHTIKLSFLLSRVQKYKNSRP